MEISKGDPQPLPECDESVHGASPPIIMGWCWSADLAKSALVQSGRATPFRLGYHLLEVITAIPSQC